MNANTPSEESDISNFSERMKNGSKGKIVHKIIKQFLYRVSGVVNEEDEKCVSRCLSFCVYSMSAKRWEILVLLFAIVVR